MRVGMSNLLRRVKITAFQITILKCHGILILSLTTPFFRFQKITPERFVETNWIKLEKNLTDGLTE